MQGKRNFSSNALRELWLWPKSVVQSYPATFWFRLVPMSSTSTTLLCFVYLGVIGRREKEKKKRLLGRRPTLTTHYIAEYIVVSVPDER